MVREDALGHEQEKKIIRGREKSDRGRGVGVEGEGSGGEGEGSGGKGEGSGEWVPPCPPPLVSTTLNSNVATRSLIPMSFSVIQVPLRYSIFIYNNSHKNTETLEGGSQVFHIPLNIYLSTCIFFYSGDHI